MIVAEARAAAIRRLAGLSDSPSLDVDLLLAAALGTDRAGVISRSRDELPAEAGERFDRLLERRLAGEPVAYILGRKGFRDIELLIDERVLVPRPETELLVEIGLAALARMPGSRRVADVGTGSGAIALALAHELAQRGRGDVEIVASDISQEALDLAAVNRARLGLEGRVRLERRDLLSGASGPFDVVLANLPYLRDDQRHPSTAREPELALYAGADGLDLYRSLLAQAGPLLAPGGIIACEIDPEQAEAMLALAAAHIPGEAVIVHDLAGLARVLVAGDVDIVRTVAETCDYGARSGTS